MLSFYRKLDLLNRIYVLNFFNLELLEQTSLLNIPKDLTNLMVKKSFYFDVHNSELLLATLPKKRIKFILDRIILDIIKQDRQAAVNSKLLRVMKKYFSEKDLKFMFSGSIKNSEYDFFSESIINFGIDTVFYHLVKLVFHNLEQIMEISILDRFATNYKIDDSLYLALKNLPYKNMLTKIIEKHVPHLTNICF